MTFSGFPTAALDFYDDLETDNTKSFWEANKEIYQTAVAEPMKALAAELESEFGTAKLFRPYRDVRFSKDKTPYKTHQGLYFASGPSTGWYVQLSAAGLMTGAGFYDATPARLAALRAAIDNEHSGEELEKIVAKSTKKGWKIGGDTVKTSPRGYSADHPRIDLLRHKTLVLSRDHGFEGLDSPKVLNLVRKDFRFLKDFVEYLSRPAVLEG